MDYLNQLKEESIRAFDHIFETMPYRWNKWENPERQTEPDLVSITDRMNKGKFPI